MKNYALFFLLTGFVFSARAREINLETDRFGSYFGGNMAMSRMAQHAYSDASGAQTEFSDEPAYDTSLEFGLMYNADKRVTIRGGVELIRPSVMKDIAGTNAAGSTTYMNLTSEALVLNPKIMLDIHLMATPKYRFFVYGGVGFTSVTLENTYDMTAAGTTQYSKADYSEKAAGSVMSSQYGFGYEMHFVDNTTFIIDAGYRDMSFSKLKLTADTDSIAQGVTGSGTTLLNQDGSKRELNMNGFYAGVAFRFYIHL